MLELIRRNIAGRRVLVTGHTGFKGSWLALWLHRLGAEVHGLALPPDTEPALHEAARIGALVASTFGDIRDEAVVLDTVRRARPEVLIHLAAQPLVLASYRRPIETFATNVMGTAHLLEAIRSVGGMRAAVVVSSDKCYGNGPGAMPAAGFGESSPLGGADPYSASKACTEIVAQSYRESFFKPADFASHGLALATARAGNVIGGGDWAEDRLVPDMVRAFAAGRPASIRNPGAVRPWQHVLEPLAGYLLLAARLLEKGPEFARGWNFGPAEADALPVRDVADALAGAWGEGAGWAWTGGKHSQPAEAAALRLDCTNARERLGWRPAFGLREALVRTAHWYRDFAAGGDARELCLDEIQAQEAALARLGGPLDV